jgi:cobalt-zinc-cadmium resistance protein CzcA
MLRREPSEQGEPSYVRVADVATIGDGILHRLGSATQSGQGEVVYVMVQMLRGENALRSSTGSTRSASPDAKKALPEDVKVEVVYDRGELVHATLATVTKNLLEGGLLVMLVLFLLLGSVPRGRDRRVRDPAVDARRDVPAWSPSTSPAT